MKIKFYSGNSALHDNRATIPFNLLQYSVLSLSAGWICFSQRFWDAAKFHWQSFSGAILHLTDRASAGSMTLAQGIPDGSKRMSHKKTPAHHKTIFLFPFWTGIGGHRCQAREGLLGDVTSASLARSMCCCPGSTADTTGSHAWAPAWQPHSAFHLRLPTYLPRAKSSGFQTKISTVTIHPQTSFLWKSKMMHFCYIIGLISGKE